MLLLPITHKRPLHAVTCLSNECTNLFICVPMLNMISDYNVFVQTSAFAISWPAMLQWTSPRRDRCLYQPTPTGTQGTPPIVPQELGQTFDHFCAIGNPEVIARSAQDGWSVIILIPPLSCQPIREENLLIWFLGVPAPLLPVILVVQFPWFYIGCFVVQFPLFYIDHHFHKA